MIAKINNLDEEPLILAIETSGRTGSVAIARGHGLLAEKIFSGHMRHGAELLTTVRELLCQFNLKPKQIKHIYLSAGPGSFTGLRIATTFAKTMHLANEAKIVTVDTLDCLAANIDDYTLNTGTDISRTAAILDAKRGQFFIAVYENSKTQRKKILPSCIMTATEFLEQFAEAEKPIWLLGEGLVYYKDKFSADGINFTDNQYWYPKASNIHKIGLKLANENRFADPLTLSPNYLRTTEIKVKKR